MKSLGSEDTGAYGRARTAELIGWVLALDERDQLETRDRGRLDREFRGRRTVSQESGISLLRDWVQEVPSDALKARIGRVRTSLSLLRGLLVGLGLLLGWAAAAALLQVEVHAGRINIVLCVGLLVVLPLALLVIAIFAALWGNWRSPGGAEGPAGISGGWRNWALSRMAMSVLSSSVRQDMEILFGRMASQTRLYAGVHRAQLFVWSQTIGLAFAVGALTATLAFVVFTDLAFGWSTTLDVEANAVHRLVEVFSSPWRGLWPDASPPLNLVETTRHFRAGNEEHTTAVDPIRYGGWWPFLVACLLAYHLVPRLLAVGFGSRWLTREVGAAILRTPEVERLYSDLSTPIVETQAASPEGEIGHREQGLVPVVVAQDWIRDFGGVSPVVIRWAEVSEDAALVASLSCPGAQIRDAGGRRSLAEDAEIVELAGAAEGGVALGVRAYEPPVLDVLDFLADMRRRIGSERGLCVLLIGGSEADHAGWRNKLVGLGDPGLRVAALPVGVERSVPAPDEPLGGPRDG